MVSGVFRIGVEITEIPSGFTSKIKTIDNFDGELNEAFAPMPITMTLEDDINVSRGNMVVRTNNKPKASQDIEVMFCWHKELLNQEQSISSGALQMKKRR